MYLYTKRRYVSNRVEATVIPKRLLSVTIELQHNSTAMGSPLLAYWSGLLQ